MVEAGATGLLLLHPSYFKGTMATEEAQRGFFSEVAQALQPTPIVLYNMPANTSIDLSAGLVASLAREHSNIVGFKDSGGNIAKLASIAGQVRQQADFSLLAGSAGFLLPAVMAGATGGICAYANLDPAPLLALVRLAEAATNGGDTAAVPSTGLQSAVVVQQRVVDLNTAITATYGVAGLKYCMWKRGFIPSPRARKPLLPLPACAQQVLDQLMART
jgi:4-hydroxy-2-oxoglutarate aldolase